MKNLLGVLSIITALVACSNARFDGAGPRRSSADSETPRQKEADPSERAGADAADGQGDVADGSEGGSGGVNDKDKGAIDGDDADGPSNPDGGLEGEEETIAADKCDKPTGAERSTVTVVGDDVFPVNVDYNDYALTFTGALNVQTIGLGLRLGATKPTKIDVSYRRMQSDCRHAFEFVVRKCPNKNSTALATVKIDGVGQTTASIDVKKANSFIDVILTSTGGGGDCKDLIIPWTKSLYGDPGAMISPL